jgi:hypothetical protein
MCASEVALGEDVLEVGPGPGMTTDALRSSVAHLTAVELDERLAAQLRERLDGPNVEEVARVLQPGGVFVASDSIASADLAAFHDDDVYNPVDPDTLDARFTKAGFVSVDVRANEFGWSARAIA